MKKILISILSLLVISCTNNAEKKSGKDALDTEQQQSKVTVLPEYHHSDDENVGGHNYSYTIDRISSDSLGIITDDMGEKYADTRLTITIDRDGARLFQHTFTKNSFSSILSRDYMKSTYLDGCRFLRVEGGSVLFSLSVSYPESDMFQPLLLTVAPDGSYNVVVDEHFEEEEDDDQDGV